MSTNYLSCNNLNNLNKRHHNLTKQSDDYRPGTMSNSRSYHNIYSSVYNQTSTGNDQSVYGESIYAGRSNYNSGLYSKAIVDKKSTIANDDLELDRSRNDYHQIINDSVNFYI